MNGIVTLDEIKELLNTNEITDKKLAIYKVANLCGTYRTDMLLELYVSNEDIRTTRVLQIVFRKLAYKFANNYSISEGCRIIADYFWIVSGMRTYYDNKGVEWDDHDTVERFAGKIYELFDAGNKPYDPDLKLTEILESWNKNKIGYCKVLNSICDTDGNVIDMFWE